MNNNDKIFKPMIIKITGKIILNLPTIEVA